MNERKPNGYWTFERCLQKLKTCETISDFVKNFHTAYIIAHKNRWLQRLYEEAGIVSQVSEPKVGDKFGTLKILKDTGQRKNRQIVWEVVCVNCETKVTRTLDTKVRNFNEITCGRSLCGRGIKYVDLLGQAFGSVVPIEHLSDKGWKCLCTCGQIKILPKHFILKNKNNEQCYCLKKLPGEASWNRRFKSHTSGCKSRNLINEINKELFIEICSKKCSYCNSDPKDWNPNIKLDGTFIKKWEGHIIRQSTIDEAWIKCNGIDRIDNDKGYTLENSVSCCMDCNFEKGAKSFSDWCKRKEWLEPGFTNKIIKKFKKMGKTMPIC